MSNDKEQQPAAQPEPAEAPQPAAQPMNAELLAALRIAVRQNEHDMMMTGEELRTAREAIIRAEQQPAAQLVGYVGPVMVDQMQRGECKTIDLYAYENPAADTPVYFTRPIDPQEVMRLADEYSFARARLETAEPYERRYARQECDEDRAALARAVGSKE